MHKAIVKQKEMTDEHLNVVISVTEDAENKNLDEKEIASTVKKALEANLGGAWQVVVGRTFGSSIHHEDNFFAYVFVGKHAYLVWRSS
uniref:Dynein light chain n=1 Tax=Romanomermis culicivorax TaxID=13658 RepID=A0A915L7T6_ROMCU